MRDTISRLTLHSLYACVLPRPYWDACIQM